MQSISPKKLTKRQQLVLQYIVHHIDEHGYPPTIREIGDHFEIKSTNGVNDHLKALERKGYLARQDAKSRALRPLLNEHGALLGEESLSSGALSSGAALMESRAFDELHEIPVLGRIAAGQPITAIEDNIQDVLHVSQSMLPRAEDIFGLVVQGDSMIEDGIFDGDIIFVKRQQSAQNGEIVAAMVDGEATVKRIYYEGERVRLQPANAAMSPIYVHAHQARETCVLGKVVGVYRKL